MNILAECKGVSETSISLIYLIFKLSRDKWQNGLLRYYHLDDRDPIHASLKLADSLLKRSLQSGCGLAGVPAGATGR